MNSWFNLLVGNLSSTIVAVCWKIRKKFLCISGSLVYPQVYPDRNQESLYQTNPNTAFWIASQIIQNFHALAASPQRWVPFNNPSKKPYAISQCLTHLKINIAPENGWWEDYIFSFWDSNFSVAMLIAGNVYIYNCKEHIFIYSPVFTFISVYLKNI